MVRDIAITIFGVVLGAGLIAIGAQLLLVARLPRMGSGAIALGGTAIVMAIANWRYRRRNAQRS